MIKDGSDLSEKLRPEYVNGITKQTLKVLKGYAKNGGNFNFLEVMCCEGGCVAGPCVIANPKRASKKVKDLKDISE
jgi:iron only hydrogenase large subunit-like protein